MKNKVTLIMIGITICIWGFNSILIAKNAINLDSKDLGKRINSIFDDPETLIDGTNYQVAGAISRNKKLLALNDGGGKGKSDNSNNDILNPEPSMTAGKMTGSQTEYGNNYSIKSKLDYDKENGVYSNPNATDYSMERKTKKPYDSDNKDLTKENTFVFLGIGVIVLLLVLLMIKYFFSSKIYKININHKFLIITYIIVVIIKFAFFLPTNYSIEHKAANKYISSFEYFNSSQINYSKLAIELIIITLIFALFYFIIKNTNNKFTVIIDFKKDKSLNAMQKKQMIANKLKNPLLWVVILVLNTLFYLFAYFFDLLNFDELSMMPSFILTYLVFFIPFLLFFLYKYNFLSKNTGV